MEFEAINPGDLGRIEIYKLLTGCVVPRPIAWVTTRSPDGLVNAAPFSAFMIAAVAPPTLLFNCNRHVAPDGAPGELKDTARNIHRTGEFVINIAGMAQLDQLHGSADPLPADTSETSLYDVALAPSAVVSVPRIAEAPASFECVVSEIKQVGLERSELIFGEVRHIWVRKNLLSAGRVDQIALDPISRLGGPNYAGIGAVVRMTRGFGTT